MRASPRSRRWASASAAGAWAEPCVKTAMSRDFIRCGCCSRRWSRFGPSWPRPARAFAGRARSPGRNAAHAAGRGGAPWRIPRARCDESDHRTAPPSLRREKGAASPPGERQAPAWGAMPRPHARNPPRAPPTLYRHALQTLTEPARAAASSRAQGLRKLIRKWAGGPRQAQRAGRTWPLARPCPVQPGWDRTGPYPPIGQSDTIHSP